MTLKQRCEKGAEALGWVGGLVGTIVGIISAE
jgi:hypothetical protein